MARGRVTAAGDVQEIDEDQPQCARAAPRWQTQYEPILRWQELELSCRSRSAASPSVLQERKQKPDDEESLEPGHRQQVGGWIYGLDGITRPLYGSSRR